MKVPATVCKKPQCCCPGAVRRRVVLDNQMFDEVFDGDAFSRAMQFVQRLIFRLIESVVSLGDTVEVNMRYRVLVLGILSRFVGNVVVA